MGAGSNSRLTPDRHALIVQGYAAGLWPRYVAQAARISHRTLREWLQRGRESDDEDDPYRRLAEDVAAAEAELVQDALGNVRAAARGTRERAPQWQADAWLLERRFGYPRRDARSELDGPDDRDDHDEAPAGSVVELLRRVAKESPHLLRQILGEVETREQAPADPAARVAPGSVSDAE